MTDAEKAKLAFLTQPAPGVFLLNLRAGKEEFYRLQITRSQLSNMIVDGTAMVLRPICEKEVGK